MNKAIALIVMFILLGAAIGYNSYQNQPYLDFNGVTLSHQDYQSIKKTFGEDYLDYRICNLNTGNCIFLRDIEKLEETME